MHSLSCLVCGEILCPSLNTEINFEVLIIYVTNQICTVADTFLSLLVRDLENSVLERASAISKVKGGHIKY